MNKNGSNERLGNERLDATQKECSSTEGDSVGSNTYSLYIVDRSPYTVLTPALHAPWEQSVLLVVLAIASSRRQERAMLKHEVSRGRLQRAVLARPVVLW